MLRNSEISSVNDRRRQLIPHISVDFRMLTLQPPPMMPPVLTISSSQRRKLKPAFYIIKVFFKGLPGQTLHILNNKSSRTKFRNHFRHRGKHVPWVISTACEPAQRKRLTRRPPCYQVNVNIADDLPPIDVANIPLNDLEPLDQTMPRSRVLTHGLTRPSIPLNSSYMIDAGKRRPQKQATTTSEKLNTV